MTESAAKPETVSEEGKTQKEASATVPENETTAKEKTAPQKSAENYRKRLDAWDGKTEGFSFVVGVAPEYLSSLEVSGKKIGNRQVRIDATKMKKIMRDHPEMTVEVMKELPSLLHNPILVLDSKTVKGRLVLLGEVYANGEPVMMALEVNPSTRSGKSTYINIIKVASAYVRTNTQNLIDTSNIRYVSPNKNRVAHWLKVNRLQLPLPNSQESTPANSIITDVEQKSNPSSEKNSSMSPEKSVVARSREIAETKVKDYDKLSERNKSMVRKVIRQGILKGIHEELLIDFANVSAHARVDVVFDKEPLFQWRTEDGREVYAEGAYEPHSDTIYINPDVQTSDGILIHELDHAIRKTVKGGEVTTKTYEKAITAVDADTRRLIAERYTKGKRMSAIEKVEVANDEVEAFYAATVLGSKNIVKHLVSDKPSLKQRILDFFKGAEADYRDVPNLDRQAAKYYRQYKKWFDEYAGNRRYKTMGDVASAINTDTRFSLIGRTEDGRGVYRTNYPENTPKDVKQKDIVDLVQNVWSKKPIKLNLVIDGKEVPIEARFNPELTERSDLSKIAFGNRKGTASEKRITMNLSSDLYQIAEESHHVGSKTESGKDNAAHEGVTTWHYFLTDLVYVEADGTEIKCYMNIDVKQNDSGHWFYSFAIEKGSRPADVLSVVTDKSATTSTISITENAEKSNPSDENSSKKSSEPAKDSLGNTLTKEQADYFKDSKVRDKDGNLLALYHGTPKENGEFYVFDNNKAKRKGGFGFASSGKGFYFTTKREAAEIYTRSGGRLLSAYVDIKNPYIVNGDIKEQISNDFGIDPLNVYLQEVRRILSSKGYDGIIQGKGDAQIVVAYYPEQIKLTSNKNPTANPDMRFSLPETEIHESATKSDGYRYTYDALTKKGDILVVKLLSQVPKTEKGSIDIKKVVSLGRENALKQNNPNNTKTNTYVYVDDIGIDVLLSKNGMVHGIARSEETALAVMQIGDLLKNSIAVNELEASAERKTEMSYALLGVGEDGQNRYLVRSLVSKLENSVTEIDIYQLGAIKSKKIETPTSAQGGTAVTEQSSLISSVVSKISIADFLENVKSLPLAKESFSAAENKEGSYLVRIIVDKNTNAISEISAYGLNAVKAKKKERFLCPKAT